MELYLTQTSQTAPHLVAAGRLDAYGEWAHSLSVPRRYWGDTFTFRSLAAAPGSAHARWIDSAPATVTIPP